jgi:hypothetical protein
LDVVKENKSYESIFSGSDLDTIGNKDDIFEKSMKIWKRPIKFLTHPKFNLIPS